MDISPIFNGNSISVIIPAYNAGSFLPKLFESLARQSVVPGEIIVIDDNSKDNTAAVAKKFRVELLEGGGKGPACARNLGMRKAKGNILAFIDADCIAHDNWIESILGAFDDKGIKIVMGRVIIPKSTFIGDVISALGSPAGGHVGFENMWHVDDKGRTDHLGSGNFAIRKDVMDLLGPFDETFPYPGGEDVEYSVRAVKKDIPIYYRRNIIVTHPARESLLSFIKWQIIRGKGNYHIKRRIKTVRRLILLRVWSSKNIIKKYKFDIKLPFIIVFLFLSFSLQQLGHLMEKIKRSGS